MNEYQALKAVQRKILKAVEDGNTNVLSALVAKGASLDFYEPGNPLVRAAVLRGPKMTSFLLELGADPNYVPVLTDAVRFNKLEAVKVLIAGGASLEGRPGVMDTSVGGLAKWAGELGHGEIESFLTALHEKREMEKSIGKPSSRDPVTPESKSENTVRSSDSASAVKIKRVRRTTPAPSRGMSL